MAGYAHAHAHSRAETTPSWQVYNYNDVGGSDHPNKVYVADSQARAVSESLLDDVSISIMRLVLKLIIYYSIATATVTDLKGDL